MKRKTKFFFKILILLFAFSLILPQSVQAQSSRPGELEDNCDPSISKWENGKCVIINPAEGSLVEFRTFQDLLKRILQILLAFAAAIALIFLVIGGFQYVMARGNEEATEKAKKTITGAVIGLALIIMSFAIVTIVNNILTQNQPNGSGAANLQQQAGQNGFNVNLLGSAFSCQIGQACEHGIASIAGGTAPYRITAGGAAQNGLVPVIDSGAGESFLTITSQRRNVPNPGNFNFSVTVSDSSNPPQTRRVIFTLTVTGAAQQQATTPQSPQPAVRVVSSQGLTFVPGSATNLSCTVNTQCSLRLGVANGDSPRFVQRIWSKRPFAGWASLEHRWPGIGDFGSRFRGEKRSIVHGNNQLCPGSS